MSKYDILLSRLSGIRPAPTGKDTTRSNRAFCPVHQLPPHRAGRNPSLSIAESTSGALLMNCFFGCDSTEIAQAVGFDSAADLFPDRAPTLDGGRRGIGTGWIAAAALIDEAADLVFRLAVEVGEGLDEGLRLAQLARDIRAAGRRAIRAEVRS